MAARDDDDDKKRTVSRLGTYSVWVKKDKVAIWPLDPESKGPSRPPPLHVAASASGQPCVLVPLQNRFGVVDVVIEFPETVACEDVELPPDPPLCVEGSGTKAEQSFFEHPARPRTARICFAVFCSQGSGATSYFEGKLKLTAKYSEAGRKQTTKTGSTSIEVFIKVGVGEQVRDLFVFFIPSAHLTKKSYVWTRWQATSAPGGGALSNATADLKLLRDNDKLRAQNRRIALNVAGGELLAGPPELSHQGKGRPKIALPMGWPLITTVSAQDHLPRAHLCRFDTEPTGADHGSPASSYALRVRRHDTNLLSGKRVLLDPGHGVVYALAKGRRMYEWFVTYRIVSQLTKLLSDAGMKEDDILRTRTAGFAAIEPNEVHASSGPEHAKARYAIDLRNKKICIKETAHRDLASLSTLLQTTHEGDQDKSVPPTDEQRKEFLTRHESELGSVLKELDKELGKRKPEQRVQPDSLRWDTKLKNYVYTLESKAKSGAWTPSKQPAPFRLRSSDWLKLDESELRLLIDRSVRWSLQCEGMNSVYRAAVRSVAGDGKAIRDAVRDEVELLPGAAATQSKDYDKEPMGWHPTLRSKFMNEFGGDCDAVVSVHLNAGGACGSAALFSCKSDPANAPPPEQVSFAKYFVKYLDPLDHGVYGQGIRKEMANNPAAMLHQQTNTAIRKKYLYLENEFMDASVPGQPGRILYQDMVSDTFINAVAENIFHGLCECLVTDDQQAGIDDVTFQKSEHPKW